LELGVWDLGFVISLQAHAKVNLTLEVLSKRPDGYHEIATVLQTISLADTLTFEHAETLEFQCAVRELRTPDNLVLKAARLLKEESGYGKGARINLIKRIPFAAGLGSGSTDAAATLLGLNRLWGLNLSSERLMELAARLGSDVPFFLYGGIALAQGRGEKLTPLPPAPELWMVLLRPAIEPVPNKTAQLYSRLNPSHFTAGQHTERLVAHLRHGGNIEPSFLYNVFEQVAFDFFPVLSDYRTRLLEAGARAVHLAGSGPTLFSLVPAKPRGESILNSLQARGPEAYLVHTMKTE
jgi:4-diphosphocytidyl-2-C-methyl-D-erythritol kinase